MDLSPGASSLAEAIREFRLTNPSYETTRLEDLGDTVPSFFRGIKFEFVELPNSHPWSRGQFLDVLSTLESYFETQSTNVGLQINIKSIEGCRANMRIEKVPTEYYNEQFNIRGTVTADSDRLEIWFYSNEVIDNDLYDEMLDESLSRFNSNEPTAMTESGKVYGYQAWNCRIGFLIPEASVTSTTMTWRQLTDGLSFFKKLVSERYHRKTIFQGKILDKNGLVRARFVITKIPGYEEDVTSVV